jgi:hydrogenase maturation protein HypF
LLEELSGHIEAVGLTVLTHRRVPANDGGLSLGQAVVGRARAQRPNGQDRRRRT